MKRILGEFWKQKLKKGISAFKVRYQNCVAYIKIVEVLAIVFIKTAKGLHSRTWTFLSLKQCREHHLLVINKISIIYLLCIACSN